MLMSTGQSIIFESNFTNAGVDIFQPMVQKYGFKYGDVMIYVDSTDYSKISYDDLIEKILSNV